MAEQTKRKVIEIDLHLVKGSRSPVRAQAGNEKLATGTQAKRTLNILQLNVEGIRNKQLELAKRLHDHDVHIALLQETLLTEDNQYTISGYMTTRCICKKCRGIATLIRNDVQAEVINTTRETDEEKHTDTQCIHVWPDNGKKYIIHNIYNPPSCKLNVEQDLPTHFNTIYTGDFNGHSPLWGYPDHNATGHIIEDMLTASNLVLLYDVAATPTLYHRSTGTTSTPDLNLVSADIVNKHSTPY